jgi:hypothetical protein
LKGGKNGEGGADIMGVVTDIVGIASLFAKASANPVPAEAPMDQNAAPVDNSMPGKTTQNAGTRETVPTDVQAPAGRDSLRAQFEAFQELDAILRRTNIMPSRSENGGAVDAPHISPRFMDSPMAGLSAFPIGEYASKARYREVGQTDPSIVVVLEGTLEGQTFLKKEVPNYDRFKAKKLA